MELRDRLTVPDRSFVDAVVFDWDGTLVDSQPLNFGALREVLTKHGVALSPTWYWSRMGLSTPDLLRALDPPMSAAQLDVDAVVAATKALIVKRIAELRLVEPVVAFAHACRDRQLRLAVASGGADDVVRAGLVATGLDELFEVVVTWEDVASGKPAPDLYLLAACRLGVPASRCLAVEDTDEGVHAARAAGMAVVDVRLVLGDRSAQGW